MIDAKGTTGAGATPLRQRALRRMTAAQDGGGMREQVVAPGFLVAGQATVLPV